MLKLKRQFSLLSLLILVVQLFAQGPNGYLAEMVFTL